MSTHVIAIFFYCTRYNVALANFLSDETRFLYSRGYIINADYHNYLLCIGLLAVTVIWLIMGPVKAWFKNTCLYLYYAFIEFDMYFVYKI